MKYLIRLKGLLFFSVMILFSLSPSYAVADGFSFENIKSLSEMGDFIDSHIPKGTPQNKIRDVFVNQGQATRIKHPTLKGVEKYIYDINLCGYYIWRWNISADYNENGALENIYINGRKANETENAGLEDIKPVNGKKQKIYKMQRPRPEAYKGEKSLGYILYERDGDDRTIDDQIIIGGGPSRADPMNMGKMNIYMSVNPWRSIFDNDKADRIVDYQGDCEKVDAHYKSLRESTQN